MEEQAILKDTTKSELSSLNIKELFFKYLRFLPLYIIFVALALIGAYVYLRYSTEYYVSTGSLLIRDEKSAPASTDNKIDALLQSDVRKNVLTEVEILQSRPLMERVVRKLNLNFTYQSIGKINELDVYDVVPFRIEASAINDSAKAFSVDLHFLNQNSFTVNGQSKAVGFGQTFTTPHGTFRLMRIKPDDVSLDYKISWQPTISRAQNLLSGLVIVPKQNTGILTITMESTSPHLSADVVNQLIKEYQAVSIEDKNIITYQKLEFIDKELSTVSAQLDSINNLYVTFRQQNNVISPSVQSESYLTKVDEADKELNQQRLLVQNVHQIEDYLRNRGNNNNVVPSSLGIEDPTLNTLIAEYNKAQQERNELLENAPEQNVVVRQKAEQIEGLRNKILENTQNIRKSFNTVVGSLQATNRKALSQIGTIPTKERQLLDIQRDLQTKAEIYNTLMGKREEAAISLASTIANMKVLQDALPNTQPVKPNRQNIKIMAVLIGLLIPTIIIVVLEVFNDKVTSRNDIERLTQTTILGEIGHSDSKETLVVLPGNRKLIAEQFRIIRSNLQYFLTHVEKPVLLITSSFSGEGKSFISTNIGAVMAMANKKTIILEFDIRKPKILSQLNIPKRPGLSNYILGKVTAAELPYLVPGQTNLYVLPCGPIPPNPSELLLDSKLDELFVYLKQNFDVIVMDTAPVGMVSDALTLSKYADATLYIVRQRHTYKKQIGLVDSFYTEGKLPKISIVLNDVEVGRGYGNYGYSNYGYGSGYFEDETAKKTGVAKWFNWVRFSNGAPSKQKKTNA